MQCNSECYIIGGPWITYDPHCPVHNGENDVRSEDIRDVLIRVWLRDISADEGVDMIEELL